MQGGLSHPDNPTQVFSFQDNQLFRGKRPTNLTGHQCLTVINQPPATNFPNICPTFFFWSPSLTAIPSNACLPSKYLNITGHSFFNSSSSKLSPINSIHLASNSFAFCGEWTRDIVYDAGSRRDESSLKLSGVSGERARNDSGED